MPSIILGESLVRIAVQNRQLSALLSVGSPGHRSAIDRADHPTSRFSGTKPPIVNPLLNLFIQDLTESGWWSRTPDRRRYCSARAIARNASTFIEVMFSVPPRKLRSAAFMAMTTPSGRLT